MGEWKERETREKMGDSGQALMGKDEGRPQINTFTRCASFIHSASHKEHRQKDGSAICVALGRESDRMAI